MSSARKATSQARGPLDNDEFAGAKLWAVYISEAENYDKALVDSWKSDMEGLLIFAGLFSASLTAFLIESYKTLNANQGTISIAVLTQISLQLDARSNASAVNISSLEAFTPTPASLACNILWFLSLWASLSCALMRRWCNSGPGTSYRGRRCGLPPSRFRMHKVVEFIPLLLHVSLLLFFAGLVAFLIPVSPVLMIMAAVLLTLISTAYVYLTVLPIFSSDSPYRTPLSNLVWWRLRRRSFWDEESTLADERSPMTRKHRPTMIEIMARDAVKKSSERDERDVRAVMWTLQSLADDNELEPFVEALPDLIWRPTGRRTGHGDMIKLLLDTHRLRLVSRIEGLLCTCDTGLLPHDREVRRRISCIKALWVIAYFSASNSSMLHSFPVFESTILRSLLNSGADVTVIKSYTTSAYSLIRWNGFCSLSRLMREAISTLENAGNPTRRQDWRLRLHRVRYEAERWGYTHFSGVLSSLMALQPIDIPDLIQRAQDALLSLEADAYDVLTEYLLNSARLKDEPYEFEVTCRIMVPRSTKFQTKLKDTFIAIIHEHYYTLNSHQNFHHIDHIVNLILRILQPHPEFFDPGFAGAFVSYLWVRDTENKTVARTLGSCNPKYIGSLLRKYLAHRARYPTEETLYASTVGMIHAILKLCWCTKFHRAVFDEETLTLVLTTPRFHISSCAIAVLKSRILLEAAGLPPDELDALMIRLQIPLPDDTLAGPRERWKEAFFVLLVEFLEEINGLPMPDERNKKQAVRTLEYLVETHPWEQVSPSLQRRFASWFFNVVNDPSRASPTHLIDAIVDWDNRSLLESLDDQIARTTICAAVNAYVVTISEKDEKFQARLHHRINQILTMANDPAAGSDPNLLESTESILEANAPQVDVSQGSTTELGTTPLGSQSIATTLTGRDTY